MWGRKPKRKLKYGQSKVDFHGRSFASKFEASVYQVLLLRERAGEISNIRCQVQVYLTDAKILYKPDFVFEDLRQGGETYAEAKGFETDGWKLKLRLWRHYGPGRLEIWKGTYLSPRLKEVVIPVNRS